MVEKNIFVSLGEEENLLNNEYYFKYIFKKTEKIVSAVFYIISNSRKKTVNATLLDEVEKEALRTLSFAGEMLSLREEEAEQSLRTLALRLTLLQSKLQVLTATKMVSSAQLHVFAAEIDGAIRSIRGMKRDVKPSVAGRHRTVDIVEKSTYQTPARAPVLQTKVDARSDRRARIVAVLRAQPGAAIKDISDTIKDYSEKTIQRDLNDMIKDGVVVRNGEKRWAKYSLFS